jgi:predicted CopG family antitoxin
MPKPVMLSDDAYRVLQTNKRPGDSFFDVILHRFAKVAPLEYLQL